MTQALLVMDVQSGVAGRLPDPDALLSGLARAADAARGAAVPVIFVRVAFRPGAPEVSENNVVFAAARTTEGMGEDDPGTRIHPALAPRPGDVVVTKRRVSAFAGSDLDVVLRSLGVDALVLSGIATSGVVLSTLVQAFDLDYRLTVLRDGCFDPNPEVHRVLLDAVFARRATVSTIDEWVATLPPARG